MDLVGRDAELDVLRAWHAEAATAGRVAVVSGEAGIGKSRLVSTFADEARVAGHAVLCGRTTEQAGAPAYWPWLQVLEQVGSRGILEAPSGPDPESERFARFEAVGAVLRGLDPGSIVVLEDVHRADPSSLQALAHVAEQAERARVLVVVTIRPHPADHGAELAGVLERILRLPGTGRVELRGLGAEAVAQLIGADQGSQVVADVLARSAGNPLYIGELVRHVEAGGDMRSVPGSVRESVRLRLTARSTSCMEVVQAAAVVGRTFETGLVATVVGRSALSCLDDVDEAVAAGLIEPTDRPGQLRFAHVIVREAVEASVERSALPALHRRVADAIEAYDGVTDTNTADLARHWDQAAVLGDRSVAADWNERAALVAERQLAWEDAVRLYERALELDPAAPVAAQVARSVAAARALLQSGDVGRSEQRAIEAADGALAAGLTELIVEAALVHEGRSVGSLDLRRIALAALDATPADEPAIRARLHGHLATIAYYLAPDTTEEHSEAAATEAARTDDPRAELSAVRARNSVIYGPGNAAERLELAERLGRAARAAGLASVAIWEPLWRIDALIEQGRMGEAQHELPVLRARVAASGVPMGTWHVCRVEAALAQASGRFADALVAAQQAREIFARLEHPLGADGIYYGFRTGLEMHAGWTEELAGSVGALAPEAAPAFLGDLPVLQVVIVRAASGDLVDAVAWYERLAPASGWTPPDSLRLHLLALRIDAAIRVGAVHDLPALADALSCHRGLHVGSGGGTIVYLGPVELWLGVAAADLGTWDAAVADLVAATEVARSVGATGFAVHAAVVLAESLVTRAAPGDLDHARDELGLALPDARRLGMPEFVARAEAALAAMDASAPGAVAGPLSARELEVAALVAEGCTNREIAERLFLSTRTAQNHVQHILTKLGFANRTQIAGWYRDR